MDKKFNFKNELKDLFLTACRYADAGSAIEKNLILKNNKLKIAKRTYSLNAIKRIYIYGFGKASLQMAKNVNNILHSRIYKGMILSNQNHI